CWGILAYAGGPAACPEQPRGRPARGFLESGPDLELESLRPVVVLRVQGIPEDEFERAERRQPRQPDAGRVTELVGIDLAHGKHVAAVDEEEGPEAAVVARAGQWHLELDAADDLDLPAERHIVDRVAPRPERAGIVAPDRTDAPGVVVLERRIVV